MPSRAPLDIRRHYGELSERETDEVVGIVADLIVAYVRKRGGPAAADANGNGAADKQDVEA